MCQVTSVLQFMFEVTDLSLKTLHLKTQVGVGRVELTQLTALGWLVLVMLVLVMVMLVMLGRWRWDSKATVRGSFSLQVCLQLTDLVLETPEIVVIS